MPVYSDLLSYAVHHYKGAAVNLARHWKTAENANTEKAAVAYNAMLNYLLFNFAADHSKGLPCNQMFEAKRLAALEGIVKLQHYELDFPTE